ncbi:MAG: hypothetical protein EBY39_03135 [Flavobacteriia bacterium]|nr:hypothetical protein [Flavobacteriia bacterium]
MATALFINRTDLVKNTIINGNVDTDLFIQSIRLAQQTHILQYCGEALYDEISNKILASQATPPVPIDADTEDLLQKFLQPMLIHFAMVDYLPFASYQIKNGGLYKTTSETGANVSKDEVDYLVQKHRSSAEFYTRRFIDYMSFNASAKFPKYYESRNEQIQPEKSAAFTGWVL